MDPFLIPADAILVVDPESQSYFWCDGSNFDCLSDWRQTYDLAAMMQDSKYMSWALWQNLQLNKCYCEGRGD